MSRNVADRRRHPAIPGRRRERVAGAHRGAEGGDPPGVDARQGPGAGDRRPPVLELAPRAEEVGLAAAVAEAAVIEEESGDPGRGETFRERPEAVPPRAREAMGHDHDGRRRAVAGRWVKPGGAPVPAGAKLEILAVHAD
jgi:hypothetical protein